MFVRRTASVTASRIAHPKFTACGALLLVCCLAGLARSEDWKAARAPLRTRWAKEVSPARVLPEHPRPQLVRSQWQNLNGLWDLAIVDGELAAPARKLRQKNPRAVSGRVGPVGRHAKSQPRLVSALVRRSGQLARQTGVAPFRRRRLAGPGLGQWTGTGNPPRRIRCLQLRRDRRPKTRRAAGTGRAGFRSDLGRRPAAWQTSRASPAARYHTPSTGIWQTVWIEPVSPPHVERLDLAPDLDASALRLTVAGAGTADDDTVEAIVSVDGKEVARGRGRIGSEIKVAIPQAKPWSPDEPFLYGLEVVVSRDGRVVDRVESYFGLRKVGLVRDESGRQQIATQWQAAVPGRSRWTRAFGPTDFTPPRPTTHCATISR